MPSSTLFRLSGAALIAAVPLWIAGTLLHPPTAELADIIGSSQSLSHALDAAAVALVLIALPGLYAHHAARTGLLGLAGFVLLMLFAAYLVYMLIYEAGPVALLSADPSAERLFAPGGIVRQGELRQFGPPLALGTVVYGIALLRSGLYSRWAGLLLIAFLPAFFILLGLYSAAPTPTRETLDAVGFTRFAVGGAHLLLHLGLAVAGGRLWIAQHEGPLTATAPQRSR
ncbi:MAG TPA: hypothetical protein VFM93_10955 [Candidatus Limnocylindria bacterium]|nr:hypothetical protein [Candidatus Limnocylindria bacterium]